MIRYLSLTAITAALLTGQGLTGSWKLNVAKSKFTGITIKYEQAPGSAIRFSGYGMEYTFKLDGKDYTDPFGYDNAWKQTGERSWEAVAKLKGKPLFTSRLEVSPDGKILSIVSKGTKPNGEPYEESGVYDRVAGTGAGLFGAWKNKETKINSAYDLKIEPYGGDGLTLTFVDFKAVCSARFGGKPCAFTGPTIPPGITGSLRKIDARTVEFVYQKDGKTMFLDKITVSPDGKTLTFTETSANKADPPIVAVYDRQ